MDPVLEKAQQLDGLLLDIINRPARIEAHRQTINQLAGRPKNGGIGDLLEQRYNSLQAQRGSPGGEIPVDIYPVLSNIQDIADCIEVVPPEERHRSAVRCLTSAVPGQIGQRAATFMSKPVTAYLSRRGDYVFSSFARTPVLFHESAAGCQLVRELSAREFDMIYAKGGRRLWREPTRTVEHALLIHDRFSSHNYCHWLLDWLPRIFPIEQLGVDMRELHVILPQEPTTFQRRSLNIMGFSDDRILHLLEEGANSPVRLRRFYGSSLTHTSFQHALHYSAPWARTYIRGKFPGRRGGDSPTHIIVDRRKSRRLVFDEPTLERLTGLGFVKVYLEDLSFDEQVALFTGARCVIGAHGAGLANIVFCEEGTQILEIFPRDHATEAYWRVASVGQMIYSCAVGRRAATVGGVARVPSHRADYDIDVDASYIRDWLDFAMA